MHLAIAAEENFGVGNCLSSAFWGGFGADISVKLASASAEPESGSNGLTHNDQRIGCKLSSRVKQTAGSALAQIQSY